MKETHRETKWRTLWRSVVVAAGAASLGVALLVCGVPVFGAEGRPKRQGPFPDGDAETPIFPAIDETLEADLWMQ